MPQIAQGKTFSNVWLWWEKTQVFFGKKNLGRASAAQGVLEWLKRNFCIAGMKKSQVFFEENLGRASAAQGVLEWLKRSFCIAGMKKSQVFWKKNWAGCADFFRDLLKCSPDLFARLAVNDQRTIRIHQCVDVSTF